MSLRITDAMKMSIAALLPEGYSVENLRMMECAAKMYAADEAPDDADLNIQLANAFQRAGGPPKITDGKPTVMRTVAWMAHSGVNKNRLAFTEEGLKKAAATIGPENPLVMDFNHQAVMPYEGAQRVIGHWYKAEYAYNPKAKKGKGAHGIMATGVFFSWAFPEISQALMADQQRLGYIRFSMACISKSWEMAEDDEGNTYQIALDPIFFTLSALDVPNADPDANGVGAEGSADPELEEKLAKGLRADYGEADEELLALVAGLEPEAKTLTPKPTVQLAEITQEAGMNEEEKAAFAALEKAKSDALARIAALEAEAGLSAEKAAEAVTRVAELEAQVAELSSSKESIASEYTTLQAKAEEQAAALAAFETKEAEAEAARVAAAAAETLSARIASLPESFQTAHAKKDEAVRKNLEEKWAGMTDTAWEFYRAEELLAGINIRVGFVERSAALPKLPVLGESDSIKARIARANATK